jgi:hypothetical protein
MAILSASKCVNILILTFLSIEKFEISSPIRKMSFGALVWIGTGDPRIF